MAEKKWCRKKMRREAYGRESIKQSHTQRQVNQTRRLGVGVYDMKKN
jgi:hypothetical protein